MKMYAVLVALATILLIPTAAQAKTLKLSYIERENLSANHFVDVDNSGDNGPTVGDYFTGASDLFKIKSNGKAGTKVGNVKFKVTFVEVTSTTFTIRLVAKVKLPGGHLYVDVTETDPLNEDEEDHVGQVTRYPINRGDGRFKGYTGKVSIKVLKVGTESRGEVSRDVFTLKK